MISWIAKLLYIFATSVQNIYFFTSFIGETIISVITWLYSRTLHVCDNVLLFFQIVYEDNSIIFFEDLPHSFNILRETVLKQFVSLWDFVYVIYDGMFTKLSEVTSDLAWSINITVLGVQQILLLLRNTLIYFGNTVWFIITFVPIHLPQLLQGFIRYIIDICVEKVVGGYMTLLQFTNFLTEVPLESFLGISVFILVARLCIYYHTTIITQLFIFYWSLIRNVMYYFYMVYDFLTNSEVRMITQMANGEDLRMSDDNIENIVNDEAANMADSLCVICQERQKCVLTLPCRHVCLCADCCRRLYGYQRTCPICRTFIYHSVTVYL